MNNNDYALPVNEHSHKKIIVFELDAQNIKGQVIVKLPAPYFI